MLGVPDLLTTIFDQNLRAAYQPKQEILVHLANIAFKYCSDYRGKKLHHILQQRLDEDSKWSQAEPQDQMPEITAEYVKLILLRHRILLDTSVSTNNYDEHKIKGKIYERRRWDVRSQLELCFADLLRIFVQMEKYDVLWQASVLFTVDPNANIKVRLPRTKPEASTRD